MTREQFKAAVTELATRFDTIMPDDLWADTVANGDNVRISMVFESGLEIFIGFGEADPHSGDEDDEVA